MKTKTIAKGKCFGSPARRRNSLVKMKIKRKGKLTRGTQLLHNNGRINAAHGSVPTAADCGFVLLPQEQQLKKFRTKTSVYKSNISSNHAISSCTNILESFIALAPIKVCQAKDLLSPPRIKSQYPCL